MLLENKTAIVYGAGGAVGRAVARSFAREGARVVLTDKHAGRVDPIVREIREAGGAAEGAEVDALDGASIEAHLDRVERIDIAFDAVGIPNTRLQGVPLVDLDVDDLLRPIEVYARAWFLTARHVARRMRAQRAGVLMTVTSTPSRTGIPLMGGVGPAMAAVEQLTRNLSAELASSGIRVVGLRPTGMQESATIQEVFALHAKTWGISWEAFRDLIAARSHGRRLSTLDEMANVAAFAASDRATGLTGTIVNLSMGALDD